MRQRLGEGRTQAPPENLAVPGGQQEMLVMCTARLESVQDPRHHFVASTARMDQNETGGHP